MIVGVSPRPIHKMKSSSRPRVGNDLSTFTSPTTATSPLPV